MDSKKRKQDEISNSGEGFGFFSLPDSISVDDNDEENNNNVQVSSEHDENIKSDEEDDELDLEEDEDEDVDDADDEDEGPVTKKSRTTDFDLPDSMLRGKKTSSFLEDLSREQQKALIEREKERTRKLLTQFTPQQERRYECYKRSTLNRSNVKKIMSNIAGNAIGQTMTIVMSGIAKIYVGEIVETARKIMDEWNEPPGPIQPKHIREAYRRLKLEGKVPSPPNGYKKRLLR